MQDAHTVPSFLRTRLLGCILAFSAPTALAAQDLDGALSTLLAQTATARIDQLFEVGAQLADLAPDRNFDAWKDALLRTLGSNQDGKARLAAALALREVKADTTFGRDVLELLKPVATGGADDVRAAAMTVLGDDRLFNTRILPDVVKLVDAAAKDELVAPLVRMEAALALWRLGGNEQQRGTAKRVLEQFLQSSDRDLRQRGALALAELNIEGGPAWAILREIQDLPTDSGRRAKLYLQREESRRTFEQMLARVVERGGTGGGEAGDYAVLSELRRRIRAQHIRGSTVSDEEMIEFAAKGMLQGLDPHSTYFTSEEYKRFFFDLNREYGGIGAFVNFDQDGDFSIVRPIYSGPAYSAGLRSGDKILEIDGWETAGHTTDEIIGRLKGKPDTSVELKWFRAGFQEPQAMNITRRQISVPAVNWAMVPGEVGYIELINFSSNISDELQVALRDLIGKGARGIVLDVRNNTGGFLTQARDVVEQFVIGKKLVVYTEGPAEPRRDYKTSDRPREVCDLPLAVLTNNFSASASEITAGALQDLGRATIIGERSFGKGSVQNLFSLASDPREDFTDLNGDEAWQEGEEYKDRNGNGKYDPGSHMKLTVAKYYLPSGRCPHREFDKEGRIVDPNWGVTPDKVLDLLENKPEDAWKNAAVFALLKKSVFKTYVKKHMPQHEQLFRELAEGDGGDASRYPEFAAFYRELDTKLSEDDVRRWLRYEVRDQISDLRGAVYPGQRALGDPQEDAQLQEAVRTILGKLGQDIRTIAAYQKVLKISFDEPAAAATESKDKKQAGK
ncbi:MAG: S41 family peptidase [Planctomycetes bacterium]|jgi:C-terminal peptidase prc|nr:S41 family peptidase [Planctomycetota bacterium]